MKVIIAIFLIMMLVVFALIVLAVRLVFKKIKQTGAKIANADFGNLSFTKKQNDNR